MKKNVLFLVLLIGINSSQSSNENPLKKAIMSGDLPLVKRYKQELYKDKDEEFCRIASNTLLELYQTKKNHIIEFLADFGVTVIEEPSSARWDFLHIVLEQGNMGGLKLQIRNGVKDETITKYLRTGRYSEDTIKAALDLLAENNKTVIVKDPSKEVPPAYTRKKTSDTANCTDFCPQLYGFLNLLNG